MMTRELPFKKTSANLTHQVLEGNWMLIAYGMVLSEAHRCGTIGVYTNRMPNFYVDGQPPL